jgi:hypothetical protein
METTISDSINSANIGTGFAVIFRRYYRPSGVHPNRESEKHMKMLIWMIPAFLVIELTVGLPSGFAHGTYTGYSGAPGSSGSCASSCHGSGTGTIALSGVPADYVPGSVYRIVVRHTAGSTIVNYNASTRVGAGSTVAGSFTGVTNASVYTAGGETGVHSAVTGIDSAVFQWTAPAKGTGAVKFFLAGIQGSKSGANSSVTITSNETSTSAVEPASQPLSIVMLRNYPNPFNPATTVEFTVSARGRATVRVYNLVGQELAMLYDNEAVPGVTYAVPFSGYGLSTGVYLAVLETATQRMTRKILFAQ